MFELRIETDNAAFDEGNGRQEVARILRELAEKVMIQDGGTINDANGNRAGLWAYDPPASCDECGEDADDGEGWDGLGGTCADALENREVDDRREQP